MCQFQFKFSCPGTESSGSFCFWSALPIVICGTLYLSLSLQCLEPSSALWLQFSDGSKIFSLSSPVVRTEVMPSKLFTCWNGSQQSPCSLWSVCVLSHSVVSNSCGPRDCSPPGSCAHEVFQSRILEWGAISYARGSSWSRDQTISLASPALAGKFFTYSATREALSFEY